MSSEQTSAILEPIKTAINTVNIDLKAFKKFCETNGIADDCITLASGVFQILSKFQTILREYISLKGVLEKIIESNIDAQSQILDTKGKFTAADKQKQAAEASVKQAKEESARLTAEKAEKEVALAKVQENLRAHATENLALKARLADLDGKHQAKTAEHANIEAELSSEKEETARLKTQEQALAAQIQTLSAGQSTIAREKAAKEAELAALQEHFRTGTTQYEALRAECEALRAQCTTEVEERDARLAANEAEKATLMEAVAELQKQTDAHEAARRLKPFVAPSGLDLGADVDGFGGTRRKHRRRNRKSRR